MRRWILATLTVTLAGAGLFAGPASAGGGPHCDPKISSDNTTVIAMAMNCFTPTIAYIEPGDEVEWVNKDLAEHTVTGALFRFGSDLDQLAQSDRVSFRFDDEGTYPYTCVLHPGMVGAVVVGDGRGDGDASITNTTSYRATGPESATSETATDQTAARGSTRSIGIASIIAVAVLALLSTRLRKRVSQATP